MRIVSTGVLLALLIALCGQVFAADPPSVPQKALDAMAYQVGEWTSIEFIDGREQPDSGHEVSQWEPGNHCLGIRVSFVEDGVRVYGSGLVGWEPTSGQLVEHWYASDGSYVTFRYSIDKQPDIWPGTFVWTYADGRKIEGESVVRIKSDHEWEGNMSFESEGQTHTWRSINRRVKK